MTSDADEATDSDGTSGDTILRELCMLRCLSGSKNCNKVSSQNKLLDSNDFSTFCVSDINTSDPLNSHDLDSSWLLSNSSSVQPHLSDKSTDFNFFSDSCSNPLQDAYHFKESSDKKSLLPNPWFKYLQGVNPYSEGLPDPHAPTYFWSRQLRNESITQTRTSHLLSTGTDNPQFDSCDCHWVKRAECGNQDCISEKKSDESQHIIFIPVNKKHTTVEYLLRKRCSSPDCACDKHFSQPKDLHRRLCKRCLRPRSVGSQVSETVLGLTLADWNGQIVIQEGNFIGQKLERGKKGVLTSLSSYESVPSALRLCKVSSVSDSSSDSAFTFLEKCSDCNLLSSLGLTRDKTHNSYKMGEFKKDVSENTEMKNGKGQAPESYGKLIHKIDKLKKITSWKSKRRKNKLKSLETTENLKEISDENSGFIYNDEKENVEGNEVTKQLETCTANMASGDHQLNPTEDSECIRGCKADLLESKEEDILKQSIMTCDRGVQSVDSETFVTTFESSLECSLTKKLSRENADIQTVEQHVKTYQTYCSSTSNKGSCAKFTARKPKRLKCDSSTSFGSCCNFFHGDDSVRAWGGLETQGEILQHLKEINKLIERESCTSTHRLCQAERNLGFEGNKAVSNKGNKKGTNEITKCKKEGQVFWAVTKVTVYPDSCRTYEVMRLSRKKPTNIPSTSETVFVLLPNK